MTATNHALTGAVIGAAIRQPWLALPLAFLSHYICDAIPHFGLGEDFIVGRSFKVMLLGDAFLCVLLVTTLAVTHQPHWLLLSISAFLATFPDLFWINKYRYAAAGKLAQWRPLQYSKWAADIQWFERPIGSVVEIAWAAGAVILLTALLH